MKTKRVLNRFFVSGLAAFLLIAISIYKVPHFINVSKLEKLGYSDQAIAAIYDKGLRKEIIKNNYYSDYLNSEVIKESFNPKYTFLYTVSKHLDANSFDLYERLIKIKGYTKEELMKLFQLNYYELTPLLVFDKLSNIDQYISDCQSHPENNGDIFNLTGDYLHPYENVIEVKDPSDIEAFISLKSSIGQYVPEKLVEMPRQLASNDVYLQSKALEAFKTLCDVMSKEDLNIYAVSAYRSFNEQKEVYDSYASIQEADEKTTRPGYLDNQSGLALSVVSVENESLSKFKDTKAYTWLKDNAHKYGFIIRYPENKQSITGQTPMPYYLRYVGEDLAKKIYDSKLTFDEYYMFYMYNQD